MITELLLQAAVATITGVLNLAPTWSVDLSGLATTTSTLAGSAGRLNGYFPLATVGVCLAAVLAVKVGMLGWRIAFFIYHQFWGSE